MLKVAVVGCGKIADSHASQLQRISGCKIVGACDTEPLMAQQFCQRFEVKQYFSDLATLLRETKPDVVHVTTPPQSHFDIAKFCLEAGCHVYVEKPFTLTEEQARRLIAIANERGRKITVGHDDQFSHVARRMRALINSGYLGGDPIHLESYYCYELGRSGYAGALLGDKAHWVRRLPGKLLHNIISHGIARIAEFLTTDSPHVIAYGFTSPMLKRVGEKEIVDELRVIISEEERATAYFTFSSQIRPLLHQFRIYGPKNGLILDQDQESLIKVQRRSVQELCRKIPSPVDLCQAVSREHKDEYSNFSEKRLPHEVWHEISDRILLSFDYGRHTASYCVPGNPFNGENHGRHLRATRYATAGRARHSNVRICTERRRGSRRNPGLR